VTGWSLTAALTTCPDKIQHPAKSSHPSVKACDRLVTRFKQMPLNV